MTWVSIEDTSTCEVTIFEEVDTKDVLYLLDGYKCSMCNPIKFRVRDVEDVEDVESGHKIIYEGAIYKGGFGYNVWVAWSAHF